MAVSDLVGAVVAKPVAAAARLARRALERIAPLDDAGEPTVAEAPKARTAPRKSKGYRRHVRREKARQRRG